MNKESEVLEVRIVKLEAMRVASFHGYGKEPEGMAAEKMEAWVKAKGLRDNPDFCTYGFNNPNPSPGSTKYGYEIWVPVSPEIEPEGDMRIVDFCGGLYAVTRFKNLHKIGERWKQLWTWREDSSYKEAHHQWLEQLLTPADAPLEEYVFDIFLPIAE